MFKGFITGILALAVTISVTSFAYSQQPATDPLAFEPTGNELWDMYAIELLEQVRQQNLEFVTGGAVPQSVLAGWESDYGADPQYWQLCAWNAKALERVVADQKYQDESVEPGFGITTSYQQYLEEAVSRGINDPVISMLLYDCHRGDLEDLEQTIQSMDETSIATTGMPELALTAARCQWITTQEFGLADALVASCPNESWAWFSHAMKNFEYGEWEAGLNDLNQGSMAENNRMPLPFPATFVIDQVSAGGDCGSRVAAGLVWQQMVSWPLGNYIKIKDNIKNQQVRLSMGAPVSELEAWHNFTCSYGFMEYSPVIQTLVALVISNVWIKHLLIQTPESLTIEQREALWNLYGRGQRVKEIARYEITRADPSVDGLVAAGKDVYARYGIELETLSEPLTAEQEAALGPEFMVELSAAFLENYFETLSLEYGEARQRINERFALLATFDPVTFSWLPVGE